MSSRAPVILALLVLVGGLLASLVLLSDSSSERRRPGALDDGLGTTPTARRTTTQKSATANPDATTPAEPANAQRSQVQATTLAPSADEGLTALELTRTWTALVCSEPDAQPLPEVTVAVVLADRRLEAVTDDDGRFTLDLPELDQAAVHLAHATHVDRYLPNHELLDEQTLFLAPAARVEGRLLPPVEGAVVRLWHKAASSRRYWVEFETTPDAEGAFLFDDLVPGEYLVGAETPGRSVDSEFGLQLAAGETRRVELEAREGGTVRGRVVEAGTERPLPMITVRFRPRDRSLPTRQRDAETREVTTDAAGRYEVRGLGPGSYDAYATDAGGVRRRDRLQIPTHGAVLEHQFELPGLTVLSGRVVDDAGQGLAGARVVAFESVPRDPYEDEDAPRVTSGSDGSFTLENVRGGRSVFLVALLDDHAPAVLPVPLEDGRRVLTGLLLEVPPSLTVRGRLVSPEGDPIPGAGIRADVYWSRRSRVRAERTVSDDEGRFTLGKMAPGRVRLWLEATITSTAAST